MKHFSLGPPWGIPKGAALGAPLVTFPATGKSPGVEGRSARIGGSRGYSPGKKKERKDEADGISDSAGGRRAPAAPHGGRNSGTGGLCPLESPGAWSPPFSRSLRYAPSRAGLPSTTNLDRFATLSWWVNRSFFSPSYTGVTLPAVNPWRGRGTPEDA